MGFQKDPIDSRILSKDFFNTQSEGGDLSQMRWYYKSGEGGDMSEQKVVLRAQLCICLHHKAVLERYIKFKTFNSEPAGLIFYCNYKVCEFARKFGREPCGA